MNEQLEDVLEAPQYACNLPAYRRARAHQTGQTDRIRRSVILVGPGKHFGAELIRRFSNEGFQIGVVGPRRSTLDQLQAAVGETATRIEYAVADVAAPDQFTKEIDKLILLLGGIDCLIYNPKDSISSCGLSTDHAALAYSMAVNVTGALVAIQSALPSLQKSENARIMITGGGYKDRPNPEKFALSVGKAGLHGLVQSLETPLRRLGVRLITVVIDGKVRRNGGECPSSDMLADFYWSAFLDQTTMVHRFGGADISREECQLLLPI